MIFLCEKYVTFQQSTFRNVFLVTKVSVTDDLEDELLEGGDDLELGNEIIDDDLFDL